MALDTVSNGTYFEFDPLCNDGSLVMFKVLEHEASREITPKAGGKTNVVHPVLVDMVVLDGPLAKTVVRSESVISAGITHGLRRKAVGTDVVVRMGFAPNKHGGSPFKAANAVERGSADWQLAESVMDKTGGDPYSAAERAANPTASLGSLADAPDMIEVSAATGGQPQYGEPTVAVPLAPKPQPPAPDAPAPWGAPPAPVGGPQGPGWGESPAVTNAQPVASGSVW